jgi:hypothetical protein
VLVVWCAQLELLLCCAPAAFLPLKHKMTRLLSGPADGWSPYSCGDVFAVEESECLAFGQHTDSVGAKKSFRVGESKSTLQDPEPPHHGRVTPPLVHPVTTAARVSSTASSSSSPPKTPKKHKRVFSDISNQCDSVQRGSEHKAPLSRQVVVSVSVLPLFTRPMDLQLFRLSHLLPSPHCHHPLTTTRRRELSCELVVGGEGGGCTRHCWNLTHLTSPHSPDSERIQ